MLLTKGNYPNPRLPLDIQFLIVDEAASDPLLHKLVIGLGLTHRALVAPCQKYLFSSVGNDKVDIILGILEKSPHIANYVKELNLDLNEMHFKPTAYVNENIQLCQKLTPKHLCLGDSSMELTNYDTAYDWTILPPDLARTILDLIHSPILRSLSVTGFTKFPIQTMMTLSRSTNFRALSIGFLYFDDPDCYHDANYYTRNLQIVDTSGSVENDTLTPSTSLQVLCIEVGRIWEEFNCSKTLNMLLGTSPDTRPLFDPTYFRHLSFQWAHEEEKDVGLCLIESATGLESLEVRLLNGFSGEETETFDRLANAIMEGPLNTLKTLKISQQGAFGPEALDAELLMQDDFCGIYAELELLAGKFECLETLEIHLNVFVQHPDDLETRVGLYIIEGCDDFAELLAAPGNFDALYTVDFSVTLLISLQGGASSSAGDRVLETSFDEAAKRAEENWLKTVGSIPELDLTFSLRRILFTEQEWPRTRPQSRISQWVTN